MSAYCTDADLARLGVRAAATAGLAAEDLEAAREAASRTIDSYLPAKFAPPLTTWGADVSRVAAILAAWDVLCVQKGINPETPAGRLWEIRYQQAIGWLEGVRDGSIVPSGAVDATPALVEGAPEVRTSVRRGW